MRQLGRFLRLERVRRDGEREAPNVPNRFSTLEAPATAPAAAHAKVGGLERFTPEPTPVPELELQPPDAAEPFVRCVHCGADSVRHATVCRQCEARLDTDEARAFNARLWAEMTAARERETQESREQQVRRQGFAAGTTAGSDEVLLAELAAQESARRALERPSGWASSDAWGRGLGSSPRFLPLLVTVALGLPVMFGVFRRGVAGGWTVLLVVLGAFAVLALRRWR